MAVFDSSSAIKKSWQSLLAMFYYVIGPFIYIKHTLPTTSMAHQAALGFRLLAWELALALKILQHNYTLSWQYMVNIVLLFFCLVSRTNGMSKEWLKVWNQLQLGVMTIDRKSLKRHGLLQVRFLLPQKRFFAKNTTHLKHTTHSRVNKEKP